MQGCAVAPYAELGVGYQFRGSTVYSNGTCANCDNPKGHVALGLEFNEYLRCEWQHHSIVFNGKPFNDRPEYSSDIGQCIVRYTWRQQ